MACGVTGDSGCHELDRPFSLASAGLAGRLWARRLVGKATADEAPVTSTLRALLAIMPKGIKTCEMVRWNTDGLEALPALGTFQLGVCVQMGLKPTCSNGGKYIFYTTMPVLRPREN